jgi:hypothetical protein
MAFALMIFFLVAAWVTWTIGDNIQVATFYAVKSVFWLIVHRFGLEPEKRSR